MSSRLLLGLVLLCSSFSLSLVVPAAAAEQWYIEFSGGQFEESVIRRAVALELREIDIPGDPRRAGETEADVSLRALAEIQDEALFVSLWDRGEFVGRRRVSRSAQPRVLARRIGLAVGQLGRQLAARRYRLSQKLERETFLAEARKAEELSARRRMDLGLRADAHALILPQGGYLVGPGLGVEFNENYPMRFNLGISWMSGGLPPLKDSALGDTVPRWSAFDLWLHADYVQRLLGAGAFTYGGMVAVSAVHVGGASQVDEIALQRDTYTARLGGRFGWNYPIDEKVRIRAELNGGSILRSMPIRHGGERLDLGGAFFGFSLGATIAPPSARTQALSPSSDQ